MDDAQLIEALRARGLEAEANTVRDRSLARQASEAGRDDVAELLEGRTAPAEQPKPKTDQQAHADAVARVLKRDTGRDFTEAA